MLFGKPGERVPLAFGQAGKVLQHGSDDRLAKIRPHEFVDYVERQELDSFIVHGGNYKWFQEEGQSTGSGNNAFCA